MSDRVVASLNGLNTAFTTAVITLDMDTALKIGAFLFVSLPLGVIQWWNLHEKWKARRALRNASK